MDYSTKLLHTADWYKRTALNVFGEFAYIKQKTLQCLIWGSKSHILKDQMVVQNIDYKAVIYATDDVQLGDQLRVAKDYEESSIFDNAEIIRITPIIHKDKGILAKELDLINVRG